jgi:hypothetical protein
MGRKISGRMVTDASVCTLISGRMVTDASVCALISGRMVTDASVCTLMPGVGRRRKSAPTSIGAASIRNDRQ